jgi:hypothetical protein
MKYCCENFEYYIDKDLELKYSCITRSYHLTLLYDDACCTAQEIWYCPWCGTKLPSNLNLAWSKVLREEYGIKDPIFDDKDKVPPEFETDEWWKKRGL